MSIYHKGNLITSKYCKGRRISKSYRKGHLVFSDALYTFMSALESRGIRLDREELSNAYYNLPPFVKEKASVILLPVGGEAGKLYAMDNRTGNIVDFNFSRVSGATYFNKAGNLITAGTNTPRIDFNNYSEQAKILIERESTNVLIAEGSEANWLSWIGTTTYNDQVFNILPQYRETNRVYMGGLKIDANAFETGQDYVVSFRSVKNSGSVYRLAGHAAEFTGPVFLDGNKAPSTWTSGVVYPDDTNAHEFLMYLNKGPVVDDSNFYIQPNRKDFLTDYNLDIIHYNITTGKEKTSYIPLSDMQFTRTRDFLSYTLSSDSTIYLQTTKQDSVFDRNQGNWNIDEDLDNEGIYVLAIFDELNADDKLKLQST